MNGGSKFKVHRASLNKGVSTMYRLSLIACLLCIAFATKASAEDASEFRERGIAAMKASQTDPRAIVEAARAFAKAADLYVAAKDDEKAVEMNSFLYWCKKKMTMEDIDAFVKGGEAHLAEKIIAVEKSAPTADEAQKWYDRAEKFATHNPNDSFLIAVRFFEIADRFKDSDVGRKAMDSSLKAMQKVLASRPEAPATAPRPASQPAAATVDNTGKRAIPAADDIKTAENLIKDLFKAEYAKSDAPTRLALNAKLLQQADENKGDAASEYVLLHEARDLAVLAGDAVVATQTQIRLRVAFKQDFVALMADLRKLEASIKPAESGTAMAAVFSQAADEALSAEAYDHAVRFNSRAEDLIPTIKDASLKARLKTEIPRVLAIKQQSAAATEAAKTLAKKPDDPGASVVAGKFALLLGQYEKSFALLAKGNDGPLTSLARQELAPPTEAADQVKFADEWFVRAENEPSPYLKASMQQRAALWYAMALPGLTGLGKLKVEGRMKILPTVSGNRSVSEAEPKVISVKTVNGTKIAPTTKVTDDVGRNGLLFTLGETQNLWTNKALENLPDNKTPVALAGSLILPEKFRSVRLRSGTAYGSERLKFFAAGKELVFDKDGQSRFVTLTDLEYSKRVDIEIGRSIAATANWKWGPLQWSIDDGNWHSVPLENLIPPPPHAASKAPILIK
jgi:hypothetical protein